MFSGVLHGVDVGVKVCMLTTQGMIRGKVKVNAKIRYKKVGDIKYN